MTAFTASPAAFVLALVAIFGGLLALSLYLASPLFPSTSRRRLHDLGRYVGTAASAGTAATSSAPSTIAAHVLGISDRFVADRESARVCALLLERADLPLRANEWYVLRALAVAAGGVGGWLVVGGSVVTALLGAGMGIAAGLLLPAGFLRFAAGRRARRFEQQLPDMLTLMASSLATGFSLPQALSAIVEDAPEPTAKEFARALAETRIGAPLEDSLDRVAVRIGSESLQWTVMAIRIQRQVGGGLAATLRTTAATLRERAALTRQVKALSAEGRLSAGILIVLPVGLFCFMLVANKEYISLLWTDVLGWIMSAVAVIGLTVGVVWMRKVVQVEV